MIAYHSLSGRRRFAYLVEGEVVELLQDGVACEGLQWSHLGVLRGLRQHYGYAETNEEDSKADTSSCSWVHGVADGDTEDERQQV